MFIILQRGHLHCILNDESQYIIAVIVMVFHSKKMILLLHKMICLWFIFRYIIVSVFF